MSFPSHSAIKSTKEECKRTLRVGCKEHDDNNNVRRHRDSNRLATEDNVRYEWYTVGRRTTTNAEGESTNMISVYGIARSEFEDWYARGWWGYKKMRCVMRVSEQVQRANYK